MWNRKIMTAMLGFLVMILFITGCSGEPTQSSNDHSKKDSINDEGSEQVTEKLSDTLTIALDAQPPSLDPVATTASATRETARLVFETLLTVDSKFNIVPMLAESVDESEDNKIYTFHLRKGVLFHNGKEMTAEDVVASMNHWKENSSVKGTAFETATFEAQDEYTVTLTLQEPSAFALDIIASYKQFAGIMPKEVIEEAESNVISEYIGTGPFTFSEWKQDQYIHFEKYEGYQGLDMEADGLAGKKEALVDEIYFYIVTDPSTRIAGLQSGEYDIAYGISYNDYERLESATNMEPFVDPFGEYILIYNKKQGIASDKKMRQAINAVLDIDEILLAAFSNENLYWKSPGYMTNTVEKWASDAGEEYYDQKDPEKAKQLLEEIGYNNEKVTLLTNRDYLYMYNGAVVLKEQLEEIGINVELEVTDWPTMVDRRGKPDGDWDILIQGSSTVSTPSQLMALSPTYVGWTDDSKIAGILEEIELTSMTDDEAKELWGELQQYAWEDYLPITLLGGYTLVYGLSDKIEGFTTMGGAVLWNVKNLE